ncbi:unnamed protein product [Prunus armeniaca]|uniref:Uncharacterized protein n=1 Tax=Prunus armeniaca TaxID=36596 RepID=A0A6J5W0P7_PRUAR|nr:unnamed protein product [Prunus armeniaca]
MVATNPSEIPTKYDRESELKAFDDTKEEATQLSIPVIDLEGLEFDSPTKRKEIVAKGWGTWVFEQDTDVKKQFYTREYFQPLVYSSNPDLYSSPATNWRDTFMCYIMSSGLVGLGNLISIKRQIQECRAQGSGKPCRSKNIGDKLLYDRYATIAETLWTYQRVMIRRQPSKVQGDNYKGL